jgi:beta-lactam-binding protein with PASTA domain
MVVRREWHVRVAESLGPQSVDVPDTVGSSERAATLELQRAGLSIGEVARLPDGGVAEGTVLSQDPPGHAKGIEQPNVSLLVAAPDDETPDGYAMPDLTGLPVAAARTVLAKVGVNSLLPYYVDVPVAPVGEGSNLPTLPAKPGTVIAQSPPAGSRIDQNTVVRLTAVK